MLLAAAGLPDALVGLVPVLAQPVEHAPQVCPSVSVQIGCTVLVVQVDRVDQLAVDVELELVRRRRCRPGPGAEPR